MSHPRRASSVTATTLAQSDSSITLCAVPDVGQNKRFWEAEYDWSHAGWEWSAAWGGPESQWHASVLPRVSAFLPARTVLEIAPGFGRWTGFLLPLCDRLIGVDIASNCVKRCRERFAAQEHAAFHQNDGRSLDMVRDGEIDFAFSFDSLVHCEADVLDAYVGELSRTLSPHGVAFIHHSNMGALRDPLDPEATPPAQGRGATMSARSMRRSCMRYGLCLAGIELVTWGTAETLNDCFSTITRRGSRFERRTAFRRNTRFMAEAEAARSLEELYGARSFPKLVHGDTGRLRSRR